MEFCLGIQNIDGKGAVGGFASKPAFGLVRWELWQILTFWFFWVKPKERKKNTITFNKNQTLEPFLRQLQFLKFKL
jgi:hypothetical protein